MNEFLRWVVGLIVLPFLFIVIFFGINSLLHVMYDNVIDFVYILEVFVSVILIVVYFVEQYADECKNNNKL